jgi:hypothetical protein
LLSSRANIGYQISAVISNWSEARRDMEELMSDEPRAMSRREFEIGSVAALGMSLTGCSRDFRPACPADIRGGDPLDGYEPRILSRKQCFTLAAAAEVMIAGCPLIIPAIEVARRADFLLAAVETPSAKQMLDALDTIEAFAGLLIGRARSFSHLDLELRRRVIHKLAAKRGLERDATRVLKLLTVIPYYSHPEVRRAVGFVDFEQRKRVTSLLVLDTSRKSYPEPEHFGTKGLGA